MLFGLAHRLLLALGLFVLAVLAVLAVEVGIFGAAAQMWLRDHWLPLQAFYNENKDAIELAIKCIGGAFTTFLALFAIYKSYYYAEFNLPDRATNFYKRAISRVVRVRRPLMVSLFGANALENFLVPKANGAGPNMLLAWLRPNALQREAKRLTSVQKLLDDEIKVLSIKKSFCVTQRVTAHIVQGLQMAADADMATPNGDAQRGLNEKALAEFQKALNLNENDLDTLQLAALQLKLMNDDDAALKHLEKMALVAEKEKNPIREAKALRFQAKILDERKNLPSWDKARRKLVAASGVLDRSDKPGLDRDLELAAIYELLGAVQIQREKFRAAPLELAKAKRLYAVLPPPDGPEGIRRIDELLKQITQTEDEPDKPGELYDGPIPIKPTHVNTESLPILEKPGGDEAEAPQLSAFTAVALLQSELTAEERAGLVLISKDGKRLGYVAEAKLHTLN